MTRICQPMSSRSLTLVRSVIVVSLAFVVVFYITTKEVDRRIHASDHVPTSELDYSSIRQCSFDDLVQFNPSTTTRMESTCWSLEEEIVRIPASSIINRDHMPKLGNGCLGGVYKSAIELPDKTLCLAALKSDKCFDSYHTPFFGCDATVSKSCVATDAGWSYRTFFGGEFLGALPWYAQYKSGVSTRGLLPTWAIVQDKQHPLRHWIPYSWTTSNPHPDKSIVGIVMPLIEFTPILHLSPKERQSLSPVAIAKIMQSSADGLVLLNRMGIAFQDIRSPNVGLVTDATTGERYSILYDNSYMGLQDTVPCEGHDIACQFCDKDAFVKAKRQRKEHFRASDALTLDMIYFRRVILDDLLHPPSEDELETELRARLTACNDIYELQTVLQDFVARHG